MTGPRGGDPAFHGKNIERRREIDQWNYRFKVANRWHRGPCGTKDKQAAEAMAAQLKQKIRHGLQTARGGALAAIASGEPFILLLPSRERYISNIDQRDIVNLMKEEIARLDGKEAIRAAPTNMLMESYD